MKRTILFFAIIWNLSLIISCKPDKKYKELHELSESDFEEYPIWENCIFNGLSKINNDLNIGQNTFSNYPKKELKIDNGFYLVKAKFKFADLTEYNGFIIPINGITDSTNIRKIEPTIFYNENKLTFWKGILEIDSTEINEFYKKLGKSKSETFPISFYVDTKITGKEIKGIIPGIGSCLDYNCKSIKFKK